MAFAVIAAPVYGSTYDCGDFLRLCMINVAGVDASTAAQAVIATTATDTTSAEAAAAGATADALTPLDPYSAAGTASL